jgi:hypothetical protein
VIVIGDMPGGWTLDIVADGRVCHDAGCGLARAGPPADAIGHREAALGIYSGIDARISGEEGLCQWVGCHVAIGDGHARKAQGKGTSSGDEGARPATNFDLHCAHPFPDESMLLLEVSDARPACEGPDVR